MCVAWDCESRVSVLGFVFEGEQPEVQARVWLGLFMWENRRSLSVVFRASKDKRSGAREGFCIVVTGFHF